MLQQTTVAAVIPYYEKWLILFPDLEVLARAPLQKVLRAWQGLGYYQRARNLHAAAKIFVRDHRGRIPADPETLLAVPGSGLIRPRPSSAWFITSRILSWTRTFGGS